MSLATVLYGAHIGHASEPTVLGYDDEIAMGGTSVALVDLAEVPDIETLTLPCRADQVSKKTLVQGLEALVCEGKQGAVDGHAAYWRATEYERTYKSDSIEIRVLWRSNGKLHSVAQISDEGELGSRYLDGTIEYASWQPRESACEYRFDYRRDGKVTRQGTMLSNLTVGRWYKPLEDAALDYSLTYKRVTFANGQSGDFITPVSTTSSIDDQPIPSIEDVMTSNDAFPPVCFEVSSRREVGDWLRSQSQGLD